LKQVFDLLVVGGGIQGAWIALEGARAGKSVLLVERDDFGSGTSANSLKVLHGGLRYLQHGNLRRIRESRLSIRSTRAVAANLIDEIPFFLETRARGARSIAAMRTALTFYGILGRLWSDGGAGCGSKVRAGDSQKEIPKGTFSPDATGVACWNEAVMKNSERLVFEVIRAAEAKGAICLNYTELKTIRQEEDGVFRAEIHEQRTDAKQTVRARCCVEATGSAVEAHLEKEGLPHLRGVNLVFEIQPFGSRAVGLESREENRDPDALVHHGNRLLFFVPRGRRSDRNGDGASVGDCSR